MPRKQKICEVYISGYEYPALGTGIVDGIKTDVKNALPGQTVEAMLSKRKGRYIGKKQRVLSQAPYETESECPDFGVCGGCCYQHISYEEELRLKKEVVLKLQSDAGYIDTANINFAGIVPSANMRGYRNKMEFAFGDECRDGDLALGIRKRDSFYEVVTPTCCNIIDNEFKAILLCVLDYFRKNGCSFYHRMTKKGVLRHLIIRKAHYTGEILVNLVTCSGIDTGLNELAASLEELKLDGVLKGFIHTTNDSVSDAIYADRVEIVSGNDYITEKLLGLNFRISPFSFFQTNSAGAEQLYSYVLELASALRLKTIYDLYSGTGTITQLVAKCAETVTGVEIVAEAVESARKSAADNGVGNCDFIQGDVLGIIDELIAKRKRPDLIILDPPRDGLHPKAAKKIINLAADYIIYISCKPTSLARDMRLFMDGGYCADSLKLFDLFPRTFHVESVVLMSREG